MIPNFPKITLQFCRDFIQRYNMKQHIKTHRAIPQELIDEAMRDPSVGRNPRGASAQGPEAGPNGDGPPAQRPNGQGPQGPNGDGPQGPAPNGAQGPAPNDYGAQGPAPNGYGAQGPAPNGYGAQGPAPNGYGAQGPAFFFYSENV